ncbi:hypothetical protein DespoDRAFT_02850 [Desulfobacter postgatei 2ac9]|uniref:Uncharacterized protein n=1 Tax=Desulfobacter postgatei 2ac9 TaxID=879212 RepID=I5B5A5_9BACT|nr:hypothetical protein DespoDRAFT_02850 [Desulfobacter postgatei 2ac9]
MISVSESFFDTDSKVIGWKRKIILHTFIHMILQGLFCAYICF